VTDRLSPEARSTLLPVNKDMTRSLQSMTPVEEKGSILFKRDDLFAPFSDVPLNGGKVRQALSVLTANADRIRRCFRGTVCTVSSVHSPQGYLIARCASSLGLRTVIGVGTSGGVEDVIERYPPFRLAVALGAEVIGLAKIGYNSVLQARLDRLATKHHWFRIGFGVNADLEVNARQVSNLPSVDDLVIPCGSGGSAASILRGLSRMDRVKRPRRVHVVQIAGMDRRKVINSPLPYEFVADRTYSYSRRVKVCYTDLELDSVYESKAFNWLIRQDFKGITCFWVIGNFNKLREGLSRDEEVHATSRPTD
jgi:1-aminocyclopropane-1-carboxylate deaminase/D-cysteine desulfhydrase-like pyridoxal-dependent ACC family enzyme